MVGLADDDGSEGLRPGAEPLEVAHPVDAGAHLGQAVEVDEGVGLDRVAVGHLVPVPGGEPGLQRHHPAGGALGVGPAGEGQHPLDVRDVGRALVGVRVVAVVRLVGQPEPGLLEVDHVATGVAVVGVDERDDEPEHPGPAERTAQRDDVTGIRDRRDPREVVGERGDAQRLDGASSMKLA